MTLAELERLEEDTITVQQAAEVLGCAPQYLRDGIKIDLERPVEMRRYLFPHCQVGKRVYIPRDGFIRWMHGETVIDRV